MSLYSEAHAMAKIIADVDEFRKNLETNPMCSSEVECALRDILNGKRENHERQQTNHQSSQAA